MLTRRRAMLKAMLVGVIVAIGATAALGDARQDCEHR